MFFGYIETHIHQDSIQVYFCSSSFGAFQATIFLIMMLFGVHWAIPLLHYLSLLLFVSCGYIPCSLFHYSLAIHLLLLLMVFQYYLQ